MKIHIYNRQKDLPLSKKALRLLIEKVAHFLHVSCEEIAFYFVDEKTICKLHEQFFNDPSPTDCITFPIDASYLGEVFVCPKAALLYAKRRRLDPRKEVALYIVHGMLHLLGMEDQHPKQRRAMREKEKLCMQHLKEQRIFL